MWTGITVPSGILNIPIKIWVEVWNRRDTVFGADEARSRLLSHAIGYSEGRKQELEECGLIRIIGDTSPCSALCILETSAQIQQMQGFKPFILYVVDPFGIISTNGFDSIVEATVRYEEYLEPK